MLFIFRLPGPKGTLLSAKAHVSKHLHTVAFTHETENDFAVIQSNRDLLFHVYFLFLSKIRYKTHTQTVDETRVEQCPLQIVLSFGVWVIVCRSTVTMSILQRQ